MKTWTEFGQMTHGYIHIFCLINPLELGTNQGHHAVVLWKKSLTHLFEFKTDFGCECSFADGTQTKNILGQVQFIDTSHQIRNLSKFIIEWKNTYMCGFICLSIYAQKRLYHRPILPRLRHNGLRVKIMNFYNQCVDFSISVKKYWWKNDIWLYKLNKWCISLGFNPLRPSDAYLRQQTRSSLVQIMACRLVGTKTLSEPVLGFC